MLRLVCAIVDPHVQNKGRHNTLVNTKIKGLSYETVVAGTYPRYLLDSPSFLNKHSTFTCHKDFVGLCYSSRHKSLIYLYNISQNMNCVTSAFSFIM